MNETTEVRDHRFTSKTFLDLSVGPDVSHVKLNFSIADKQPSSVEFKSLVFNMESTTYCYLCGKPFSQIDPRAKTPIIDPFSNDVQTWAVHEHTCEPAIEVGYIRHEHDLDQRDFEFSLIEHLTIAPRLRKIRNTIDRLTHTFAFEPIGDLCSALDDDYCDQLQVFEDGDEWPLPYYGCGTLKEGSRTRSEQFALIDSLLMPISELIKKRYSSRTKVGRHNAAVMSRWQRFSSAQSMKYRRNRRYHPQ